MPPEFWLDGFCFAPDAGAAAAIAGESADPVDSESEEVVDASDGAAEAQAGDEAAEAAAGDEAGDDSATEAAPPSLGDVFKQHGLDGLPSDPRALGEQWRQMQARAQEAEQYRQQLMWLLHSQQQQAAAAQAQQKPAEAAKPKLPWEIPEYDPNWTSLVKRDEESGHLVPVPGAQMDLPQKINAYARAREQAIDKFLRDPYGTMQEGLMPAIQQQAQQIAQSMVAQYAEQSHLERLTERNAEWALDAHGQISSMGQRWNGYYTVFRQQGHAYRQASALADKALSGDLYEWKLQQEQANPPAPAQKPLTHEQKQVAALRKMQANVPNRNGAGSKSGKPRQEHKDIWRDALGKFKALPEEDFATV